MYLIYNKSLTKRTQVIFGERFGFEFSLLPNRVHARPSASQCRLLGSSLQNKVTMKINNIITVLLVALVLASCTFAPKTIPTITILPRADNFSFIFQDYSCGLIPVNILNTISNTLIHTPLGDTVSITIPLHLTDDELESVYQKAISIGFFDYPSKFVIPDDQVIGYHSPASSYEISITNGEATNSITWTDDTLTNSSYTKADKLRELMYLIDEIIQSHSEIQPLPEPKALCA